MSWPNDDDALRKQAADNKQAETNYSLLNTVVDEPRRRPHSRWNSRTISQEDWWVWELAGLVVSAAALLCIVVFLWKYDGKQQPKWEHFSLNTVVAWLSTIGKASVLVAASRGIGQLKWIWFADDRRSLADIQIYDAASRGVFGCLLLLWKLRFRYLTTFGSVAVILALGFDPFLQNLVRYYSKATVSTTQTAYLGNATLYDSIGPKIGSTLFYVDSAMKANLYSSLMSAETSQQWGISAFTCSTGNCTWDPIATLAIHSLCTDLTHMLETSCEMINSTSYGEVEKCIVSLEGSESLSFTNDLSQSRISLNMTAAGQGTSKLPLVYKNQTFPVVRYVSAIGNGIGIPGTNPEPVTKDSTFVATECALEPYVVSIQAQVTDNIYSEKILEEWSESNATAEPGDFIMPSVGGSLTFSPSWGLEKGVQPGTNFTMNWDAWNSLGLCIQYTFNGSFESFQPIGDGSGKDGTSATGGTMILTDRQMNYYPAQDAILALVTNNFTSHTSNPHDKLSGAMSNVARALTKSIRDVSYVANGGVANEKAQMATGKTMVAATFVRIQWSWLALPIVVWLLTVITWVGTAWETKRIGIMSWGNNTMPLLFLRRDASVFRTDIGEMVSCRQYLQQAEEIRVQLRIAGQTAAFS